MEANNVDVHSKYQKLASEYSKVRAQVSVLRKAVIEEQTKGGELKDSLKEKDQSLRKHEQEIESLTFRNQQLSKRVTILQDELEGTPGKPKKVKHKGNDSVPAVNISNSVIGEELRCKIEENAKLHQQLYETDQEHRAHIAELTLQLESSCQQASRLQQILDTLQGKNETIVDKLQHDKAQMEVNLQSLEKELKECRAKAQANEEILKQVQCELGDQLQEAQEILEEHVTFNDTKLSSLNALNLPVHDHQHQTELQNLLLQVSALVHDLVLGLSNLHTYTEQRVTATMDSCTNDGWHKVVVAKFAQHLHENAIHLRSLEQKFQAFVNIFCDKLLFLEFVDGMQEFADSFSNYVAYLNKLLPYHLFSIEEECSLFSCTPALEVKNRQFYASVACVTAAFGRIETYVSALAYQSDPRKACPRVSQIRLIHLLVDAVHHLLLVIKESSGHYNAKVSLEHQLPTITQKLKTTDECVLSSMISLVTTMTKLSALLKEKLLSTKTSSWNQVSKLKKPPSLQVAPVIKRFRYRTAQYLEDVDHKGYCRSVPFEEALRNREILQSSTESQESLTRQLASSQDRISTLEQAKEHWMLEFQLLQIKHEKDMKKLHKVEEQLRGGGGSDVLSTVSSSSSMDDVTPPASATELSSGSSSTVSLLGKLDILGSHFLPADSREAEIKSYFLHHVKELVSQMQMADSKATIFFSELLTLQKRLQVSEKGRTVANEELAVAQNTIATLKEELSTTATNYESQLSMMSEHLANMNDKLTAQKDEIDALHYQLNHMGSKKGKNK